MSDQDADSPCGKYVENRSYLGFMGAVLAGNSTAKADPCVRSSAPSAAVEQTAKNSVPIVAAALGKVGDGDSTCAHIPADQRRDKSEKPLKPFDGYVPLPLNKNCWNGIKAQVMAELKGIKEIAQAWYKAGLWTGVANVARAFADDPGRHIWEAMVAVANYYAEDFYDFNCLKNSVQMERVCKFGSKIVLTYLTGKALNPAFVLAGRGTSLVANTAAKAVTQSAVGQGVSRAAKAVAESRVGDAARASVVKADAVYDKIAEPVKAAGKALKTGAKAVFSNKLKSGTGKAASAGEQATEQASTQAVSSGRELVVYDGGMAEQIVPPEARKASMREKAAGALHTAKKGSNAVVHVVRSSTVGDQLEYQGQKPEFEKKKAAMKAEDDQERDANEAKAAQRVPAEEQPLKIMN